MSDNLHRFGGFKVRRLGQRPYSCITDALKVQGEVHFLEECDGCKSCYMLQILDAVEGKDGRKTACEGHSRVGVNLGTNPGVKKVRKVVRL